MHIESGVYEVLSADQSSVVHGNAEAIGTTHFKRSWLKNLADNSTREIQLTNSTVPLVVGKKIGLAFLNGEVIAFKRSRDIPVEDPIPGKVMLSLPRSILMALWYSLLLCIPIAGYIGGMMIGAWYTLTGGRILGRYRRQGPDRLYALFVLIMSSVAWFPNGHGLQDLVDGHLTLAFWVAAVTVLYQVFKVEAEKEYYRQAAQQLNEAWAAQLN